MSSVRIVFPEIENEVIQEAVAKAEEIEAVGVSGDFDGDLGRLRRACEMVREGEAEGLIAGIDYTSRDVILAVRDGIGMTGETFSASFVLRRPVRGDRGANSELTKSEECYVIGDAAACKNPTAEQLYEITLQTYDTAKAVLTEEPQVALLSFSTFGSGGKDPSIERATEVVRRIRTARPEIQIDGEMQLDTAVSRLVAAKKAPSSGVAGNANVLILPDLNSGNILYKAMEQFGGFTAAGPILQGFKTPCSDLSRGSTVEDVLAVIEVVRKQILREREVAK